MKLKTKTGEETQALGRDLAKEVESGGLICLYGDLGAGKTTFTQGLARELGVEETVVSPTFIIMRQYKTKVGKMLYHIDLYRLNDLEEARKIGIEEIIGREGNIVVIEWPEKIEPILPRRRWEVRLSNSNPDEREISYEALH